MKKYISSIILVLFFFTFLIGNFQGSYDRIAPQFLVLSTLNIVASLYLGFKYGIYKLFSDLKGSSLVITYSLYIFICIISFSVAFNKSESLIVLSQYLTFYMSFLVIYLFSLNAKINYLKLFISLSIISIIIESYGVLSTAIDYFLINGNEFARSNILRGYSGNINIVSYSIAIKLPVLLYVLFRIKSKLILTLLSMLLFFCSIIIFMLMSRGAFIAFIFVLIVVLLFKLYTSFKQNYLRALLVSITVIMSFGITETYINQSENNVVVERLGSLNNTQDPSINSRLRYFNDAYMSIKSNPLIGIGIGNWKFYSILYDYDDMEDYIVPVYVHNDFLHTAAEIGIIGLIVFIFIFVIPLLNLMNFLKKGTYSNESLFLILIIGVYIIDSMLNFPVSRPISYMYLIFAVVAAIKNKLDINDA
jgi:O-antigen ligase